MNMFRALKCMEIISSYLDKFDPTMKIGKELVEATKNLPIVTPTVSDPGVKSGKGNYT